MAAPKRPNPVGMKSDKEWRDAIRLAVHRYRVAGKGEKAKKFRVLQLLADKVVSKALDDGDMAAIKEIGDRLDGRPAQSVSVSGGLKISHEEALKELE